MTMNKRFETGQFNKCLDCPKLLPIMKGRSGRQAVRCKPCKAEHLRLYQLAYQRQRRKLEREARDRDRESA